MDWSFNAAVGTSLHLITMALLAAGIFTQSNGLVLFAGYASIANGSLLLANTIINRPYIGTVLAPVMLVSMALLVIVGIGLVSPQFNLLLASVVPNVEIAALFVYMAIFILAAVHMLTGL